MARSISDSSIILPRRSDLLTNESAFAIATLTFPACSILAGGLKWNSLMTIDLIDLIIDSSTNLDASIRSEERRVGKECRCLRAVYYSINQIKDLQSWSNFFT